MSEEVDKTKTETENGIPETSTLEEKECNGASNIEEESTEPSSKNSSKFGANLKMKALHAKEGISTKVGGLKEKFARYKRKSEESVSFDIKIRGLLISKSYFLVCLTLWLLR